MSLQRKSFTNLVSPSSNFKDGVFVIKQNKVAYEQGFSLNYIDGLSGVSDSKVNNYSFLYLTDLKRDDEIFNFNELVDTQDDYITYIKYRDPSADYFLYFDDTNAYSGGNFSFSFKTSASLLDISRTYFEIETIDQTLCRIKRRDGDNIFYLVYDKFSPYSTKFYFTTAFSTSPNITKNDIFSYVLDKQGYAVFLKRFASDTYILAVNPNTITFELQPYTSNTNYLLPQTLFGVDLIDNLFTTKINTSWVSYDTSNLNNNLVNNTKSVYNLKNNNIIHFEYNNITDVYELEFNDIKLKNQVTNKNVSKRGNANIVTSENLPTPFFREYSELVTGNNEEIGYDDIGASYVFYNQDYLITPGSTIFNTPSSIFPYTQLNINDASFVRDGALAGISPSTSDRIFKNIETNDSLQGNYLTTWLSGSNIGYGQWLDRYYFPNIVSKQTALSSLSVFSPTFQNPASQTAYSNASLIEPQPYYDVISNFTILPNEEYTYVRPTTQDVSNFVKTYNGIVQYDFSSYINSTGNTISVSATELQFSGDKVVSIPVSNVNSSGTFSVFFEIEGNWKQKTSYIFGSLVNTGFAVYNDERITSFIYTTSGNNLNTLNVDGTLIYSLSFPTQVLDVICENQLEDYFVTTLNNSVYRIGSDGAIKDQYSLNTTNAPLTGGFVSYINYTKIDNILYFLITDNGEYTAINLDNGSTSQSTVTPFISGDNLFRSLYVYNNTVYGFPGEQILLDNTTLYNLVSGKKIESYNLDVTGTKNLFTVSNTSIQDFTIDDNGVIYVLHSNNKLTKIDSNRKFLSTETFLPGVTGHKIDFASYYADSRVFYPIIVYTDSAKNGYILNYSPTLSTTPIPVSYLNNLNDIFDFSVYTAQTVDSIPTLEELISGNYTPPPQESETPDEQALIQDAADNLFSQYISIVKKQRLTNYNHYNNNLSYNNLNFVLRLGNIYNPLDLSNISFSTPLENLSDFRNAFLIMYDDKEGLYSIYINSVKVFSQTVDKSKYTFNTLLNNNLILGSLGFYNNLILSQFVRKPGFLYGYNYSVNNFRFYSSRLNDEQINGVFLEASGMQPTYITIPCGQRSNTETMQSIFKLTQPYNKSNTINLNIKNTGITNTTLQTEITAAIIQQIGDILPGDVNIKTVNFINY